MSVTSEERRFEAENDDMDQPVSGHSSTKTAIGFTAAGIIPFLLLADTLAATLNGWSPSLWLEWATLWTIVIWSSACLMALMTPRTRVLYSRRSAQLVLMHGMTGFLLLAGQLAFSVIGSMSEVSFHHRAPNEVKRYRPKMTNIRGIYGESIYTTNSRGIRGPEMESTYARRLLFIGGSTTECTYLDDTETWPYLCADRLQQESSDATLWAGNVGRSGYTTVQHLKYIREDEQFSEYDTAVFMIGANDLLVWLNFKKATRVPLWERTGYFAVLRALFGVVWPWTDPMSVDPTGSNYRIRRHWRANGHVVDTHPPVERMLRQYEQRVADIIDTCHQKGVQPVFITQPTLWAKDREQSQEADLWTGRIRGTNDFLSIPKLRELLDRINALTLSVCAAHEVPCVNLEDMSAKEEFFYDDFHFTEAGARAVADAVSDVLLNLVRPENPSEL